MQRSEQIEKLKQLELKELDEHIDGHGETRKKAEYRFGKNLYVFEISFLHETFFIKASCVEYGPDVCIETTGVLKPTDIPVFPDDYMLTPGVFCQTGLWRTHAESYARNIIDCTFFVDLMRKNPLIFLSGEVMDMIKNEDFTFLD